MSKKQNITVGIDIEAKVDSAQKSLVTLQKSFAKLNLSDAMQSEFSSLFSSIDKELNKIVQKTASGKISLVDVASVQKSFEKIEGLYATLNKKIAQRGIMKSGLQEDAAALNAITGAVKLCDKAIESSAKQEEKLNKTLEAEKIKRDELLEKQKLQKTVSEEELLNQKLKLDNAKKLEKAAKKELEQAKKALDAKIAASGGKYTEADITKKGSALRKTDAYKAYKDAAQKYTTASANTNADSTALKGMVTPAMQAAELKKVEEAIESAEIKLQEFNETSAKNNLADSLDKAKKALESLEIDFSEYGVDIKDIKSIDDLREALEKVKNVSGKKTKKNLQQIAEGVEQLDNACEGANNDVKGAGEALEDLHTKASQSEAFEARIKDFLGLSGAAQLLRSSLRNAMQTITELDETMTEMAVVTDLGVGDYWKQLPEYTARAKELGLAIGDVYKADTLFYQQGLKTNEVVEISTQTMKMAAIAGLDTATATDRMTAALRGFNMELNETSAQKVSDVYSELAAITAADVDEISNAMTKTASIASSAGMEFETTAAFLSQIIETTRESAETAGTAMKTIVARFQELKKDPSEIGEIDGEVVDANAIETALRSVGVALRDSSGQFRELDDVFLELSSKWDGLDKNTQRYIATIAAGSRQQSRFIAMMSDYGRTQELVTAANTSAGASNKQFEKTVESIQYKLNNLKAAWDEFTMGIMNSELVKKGVDVLTKFLEVVNKATGALDGVGGSLTKIIGIVGLFKLGKKLFDKFADPITKFFLDLTKKAHQGGYDAAKAYVQGGQKAAAEQEGAQNNAAAPIDPKTGEASEQKKTLGQKVAGFATRTTGFDDFANAKKQQQEAKYWRDLKSDERLKKVYEKKQQELDKKKKEYTFGENGQVYKKGVKPGKGTSITLDKKEAEQVRKEYEQLNKEVEAYNNAETNYIKASNAKWESVNNGLNKAGAAATGVGMAMSALGGILSEMGFEEFGEGVSTAGNYLMIFGSILSALPAIFSVVSAAAKKLGIDISISLWQVTLIVAAIAAVVGIVMAIASAVKKASPEYKLEQLEQATEAAAEAADHAAEAYENLNESVNAVADNKNVFKDLVKGTLAWREALAKNNAEVLELIDTYPELAEMVIRDKDGVLSIDVESAKYQNFMNELLGDSITAAANKGLLDAATDRQNALVATGGKGFTAENITENMQRYYNNAHGHLVAARDNNEFDKSGNILGVTWQPNNFITKEEFAALQWAEQIHRTTGNKNPFYDTDFEVLFMEVAEGLDLGTIDFIEDKKLDFGDMETFSNIPVYFLEAYFEEMSDETFRNFIKYARTLESSANKMEIAFDSLLDSIVTSSEALTEHSTAISNSLSTEKYISEYNTALDEFVAVQGTNGASDNNEDYTTLKRNLIEDYWGSGAILKDDKIYKNGEIVQEGVNDEFLKSLYASNEITKQIIRDAYNYEKVVADLSNVFADETLGSEGTSGAIQTMFEKGVGALTKAEVDIIKNIETNLGKEWATVSAATKDYFGEYGEHLSAALDDNTKVISKTQENIKSIDDTISTDVYKDYMTLDQASMYAELLGKIIQFPNKGVGAAGDIDAKTNLLLGLADAGAYENTPYTQNQFDDETRREIQSRINMTDWSSIESLLALQLDLELEYGISTEAAKDYTQSIGKASYATSRLATTLDVYGELWKATERINQSLERLAQLQWEYNRALESGGGNIEEVLASMVEEYKLQAENYEIQYNDSLDRISTVYAQGGIDYAVDLREAVTLGATGIDVDNSKIQEFISAGKITQEDADKWLDSLNEEYGNANKALEGMRESVDNIEQLEKDGEEVLYDLRNMAKEAILASLQEQIDLQKEAIEATNEANSKLLNELQEQVNETRKLRENSETEKNISDLRSKVAYLGMDSSGANALKILQLNEEIANAEQNYADSLVDQSIQSLQDANEKAAEQRERQIAIAEDQLEAYETSKRFQEDIDRALDNMLNNTNGGWEKSNLGQVLVSHFTKEMSNDEKNKWLDKIGSQVDLTKVWGEEKENWKNSKNQIVNALNSITDAMITLGGVLTGNAAEKKVSTQIAKLSAANFNPNKLSKLGDEQLDTLSDYASKESKESIDTNTARLNAAGIDYESQYKYYDTRLDKIATGEHKQSYTSYLEEIVKTKKAQAVDDAIHFVKDNNYNGLSGYKNSTNYLNLLEQYTALGGSELDFNTLIQEGYGEVATGDFPGGGGIAVSKIKRYGNSGWYQAKLKIDGDSAEYTIAIPSDRDSYDKYGVTTKQINELSGQIPSNGWTAMYNGIPYVYHGGAWRPIETGHTGPDAWKFNTGAQVLEEAMKKRLTQYKTGGTIDFTGPAWLDGTPSKPEYILNSAQTERFFSLVDVLERFDSDTKSKKHSGDNYFDIEINVEKLENDYGVEQVADKIRRMIYDDAAYRNVNTINHIR